MRNRYHHLLFILLLFIFLQSTASFHLTNHSTTASPTVSLNKFPIQRIFIPKQPSTNIPVYSVYLTDSPKDRYKQIIQDKKALLNQFIDHLYQIDNFQYTMWLAKIIFYILPQNIIRNHLGAQFYDQCKGIALHSQRQLYEIIVYNYMYQIGAAQDFCTSIAVTQTKNSHNHNNYVQKQNLSLLARNLDYGFQKYLVDNTVRINFYQRRTDHLSLNILNSMEQSKLLYTTLTHAGFVSSHTVLKYETQENIQFGLTLNQRKSQNIISTLNNIILTGCESVFQLTNRLLTTSVPTIQHLILLASNSKSCSKFYFIVQTKDGDHAVIQKNQGVGAHRVYFDKAVDYDYDPFFVVQTNTDRKKKDPDGRRDLAIAKINKVVWDKGYLVKEDLKKLLLEPPNFNDQTLMTALIDVKNGSIEAMVWDIESEESFSQVNKQKMGENN